MRELLRLAMLAVVAAVSAMSSAEAVVRLADRRPELVRAARVDAPQSTPAPAASAPGPAGAVMKASDGHFWADGEVDGTPVRFLVDTGATAVSLTPADAQRLGIDLHRLEYSSSVVTAGGRARAAPVRLASVKVGEARLEDVDALVIETGLEASLLGMSYLGRLSSFQATRQALILNP